MPDSEDTLLFTSRSSNACALLSAEQFQRVVEAAELYVASRSALDRFIATLGNVAQQGVQKIPEGWQIQVQDKLRDTLNFLQRASTMRMVDDPGRSSSDKWYTATVLITGGVGGAFGLPAVLAELPITTGVIFRSIADIGRSHGEQLDDAEFRATCLEVFAYGTPFDEDDNDDI